MRHRGEGGMDGHEGALGAFEVLLNEGKTLAPEEALVLFRQIQGTEIDERTLRRYALKYLKERTQYMREKNEFYHLRMKRELRESASVLGTALGFEFTEDDIEKIVQNVKK